MNLSHQISSWIKKQVIDAGRKGIVVGLSGGIDSSVVAALSKKALGANVFGLILPCRSSGLDEKLAMELAKKFDIKVKKVDLTTIFDYLSSLNPDATDLAKANLKPRLRMLILYYFANSLDYLVAGTGNKSELMIGYFTKHGDGGCDILPIGGLLKTEVKKLAKELDIPADIIKRAPSAGLWDGQTDEGEIGMSYECLDKCLQGIEEKIKREAKDETLIRVECMVESSAHKRKLPAIFTR